MLISQGVIKLGGIDSAILSKQSDLNRGPCTDALFYAAPEQFSDRWEEKSDVWSLGIVVHYALYGVNPYYDLVMQRRRKEDYLESVCMEKEKWGALGPKLRCGGEFEE